MAVIPGRNSAASVIAAPTRPAPTRVARTPSAAATGAVSANEMGSRPIEISQSRLETRPSIELGTWRCLIVAQTIVPAVSSALKTRHASISCHAAVAAWMASLTHQHCRADRADAARREDEPEVAGRGVQLVLDHVRQQHLA